MAFLINRLKNFNKYQLYLLQHCAHGDNANDTRHMAHYVKT